jgi:hypothetical protein
MKTTLDLPDEIVHEVKLRALMQRRTVKDLVAELLRQGLGMGPRGFPIEPPTGRRVEIGEDGLPVFRCGRGAAAARMTVQELLALEDEADTREDMERAGQPL